MDFGVVSSDFFLEGFEPFCRASPKFGDDVSKLDDLLSGGDRNLLSISVIKQQSLFLCLDGLFVLLGFCRKLLCRSTLGLDGCISLFGDLFCFLRKLHRFCKGGGMLSSEK